VNIALFAYAGDTNDVMRACINSLRGCSDCRIMFYGQFSKEPELGVPILPLEELLWHGRRVTRRMELAAEVGAAGDQVMVFDTDLYFKRDPFELFEHTFDFFYTTRPVPNLLSPVNGGVWGFRVNSAANSVLQFMVREARHPEWPPYLAVRQRLRRTDRDRELDWWSHQDLLCALHEAGSPVDCQLYDAGPCYNWCPDSGPSRPLTQEGVDRFLAGFDDPAVVIIHYKELEQRCELRT
jgi:hypothetical protein